MKQQQEAPRRPLGPGAVVSAVLLLLFAVAGIVILMGRSNDSTLRVPALRFDAAVEAFNIRDTSGLIAAMAGDPNDREMRAAIQSMLASAPKDMKVSLDQDTPGVPNGDVRVDRVSFRVTAAGQVARIVTFEVVRTRSIGVWTTVALIPAAQP